MTAQELLQYSHEPYQQELIDGILHEMEPPGAEHGAVSMLLGGLLITHVRDNQLGMAFAAETGFKLRSDPDTVRAPDASFISQQRLASPIPKGYWPGPPDLAIEVVSHHDRLSTVKRMARDWIAAGARAAIVVDPPSRTATVFLGPDDVRVLHADECVDVGDVVPDWTPLVADFFAF